MHAPRCKVSYSDTDGTLHEVSVYASSVYEAIGQAVHEFRIGSIVASQLGPMTEFSVEVHRQPVTHRLRLKQVTTWAESSGKSPQDTITRNRVRGMLSLPT